MRRGFMKWSHEELAPAVLDARLVRLRSAMQAEGLSLLLLHTSFNQPAAVHWVTNFTPYWSEAVLVVPLAGAPVLLASLTERVHPWIREVSNLMEVKAAPRLGAAVAAQIEALPVGRVGVVDLHAWPASVLLPLGPVAERLVDASALFASVRQPADQAERDLFRHAARIAGDALRTMPASPRHASEATAAIEASARLAGAEEVLQRVAPDLGRRDALMRMEGSPSLGDRFAVEVSVAYKGAWARVGRSLSIAPSAGWGAAQHWFDTLLGQLGRGREPAAWPRFATWVDGWTLEACIGGQPLAVVSAGMRNPPLPTLPDGTPVVLGVELDLPEGRWLARGSAVLGEGSAT